jgi:hypothetical protein
VGDGPPTICELHDRLWRLNDELGLHETARFWLGSCEEQAGFISCEPLEEAMRFVRAEADLEMARLLEREIAAAESEE